MPFVKRFSGNPILQPNKKHAWESDAAFNGCPITVKKNYHLLYRAQSAKGLSTIGDAVSSDRVQYTNRRQLIIPNFAWERHGCEDPRVTYMDNAYYIFYTAIADWPPKPTGIKAAVAVTRNFKTIDEKHLVTPFNAKAMTMFPERVNGKIAVMLTANSDYPPSTIGISYVDTFEELWNKQHWLEWYKDLKSHAVPLLRSHHDHVEIGAPPILTEKGWLLIYSYIKSYLTSHKFFTIEAALLDLNDPQKVLGVSPEPLLFPEYEYELSGNIGNIVFPSGALIFNRTVGIYYGAADTSTCLATCSLDELLESLN